MLFDDEGATELKEVWHRLSTEQQQELYELATMPDTSSTAHGEMRLASNYKEQVDDLLGANDVDKVKAGIQLMREVRLPQEAQAPETLSRNDRIARARFIVANPAGRVTRVQRLLSGLAKRLSEPHSFRVFQKNSVNFGIVTTYRQEWKPGAYQVGNLVGTLPLAPGETRKYTRKQRIKKSRSVKENERYASTLNDERAITSRAIADIIQKASSATNFEQSVQTELGGKLKPIGFDVGMNTSSQFQRNQGVESERVKKGFHETVRKASQEFKDERALEVTTDALSDLEEGSTNEISNPNNEITVTYLFYELERQYRVTEHLHRLTPVVLVAAEVPNPSDIDDDWLVAHEWILRRSLLDDGFNEALDIVSEGLIQDEVTVEIARQQFETQKTLVEELSESVESLNTLQETLRNALVQTTEREKLARVARKRNRRRRRRGFLSRFFLPAPDPVIQSGLISAGAARLTLGSEDDNPALLEARREALETRLEFLEGTLEDERGRLTRASSALEKATEELTAATRESFARRLLVDQLRIHVKDNILYYMQSIWTYEKPDQRFFRLYDVAGRYSCTWYRCRRLILYVYRASYGRGRWVVSKLGCLGWWIA